MNYRTPAAHLLALSHDLANARARLEAAERRPSVLALAWLAWLARRPTPPLVASTSTPQIPDELRGAHSFVLQLDRPWTHHPTEGLA